MVLVRAVVLHVENFVGTVRVFDNKPRLAKVGVQFFHESSGREI